MMRLKIPLFLLTLVSLIPGVLATTTSYVNTFSSIMGRDNSGLLINLHIQDFTDATTAITYYNYIAALILIVWGTYATSQNEGKFAFTTPLLAGVLVWFGWLNAGASSTMYWGQILLCLVLGAVMVLNEANHRFSPPVPGDKVITIAVFFLCMTTAIGFVGSPQLGLFNTVGSVGATANPMCGGAYQCDANGNIDMGASVSSISNAGGANMDVVSSVMASAAWFVAAIKLLLAVLGAVVLIGPFLLIAYPFLNASPQVVAFLYLLNGAIVLTYLFAIIRIFVKPSPGGLEI
jgi:hypothetical protein